MRAIEEQRAGVMVSRLECSGLCFRFHDEQTLPTVDITVALDGLIQADAYKIISKLLTHDILEILLFVVPCRDGPCNLLHSLIVSTKHTLKIWMS